MTKSRFCAVDHDRIERLTTRVSDHLRRGDPTCRDVPRASVLRALLRQGLDLALAETQESAREGSSEKAPLVLLSYRISAKDADRLEQVRDLQKQRSPLGARPSLPDVQRRIIHIALTEAETYFLSFVRAVLAARHPRTRLFLLGSRAGQKE